MTSRNWFRNETWDETIEEAFFTRLKRARDKAQYLVIQAIHLVRSHPKVALQLLDKYFELDDRFNQTRAFDAQAVAYLELNDVTHAISSYEHALDAEQTARGMQTQAYVDLPFLVAPRNVESLYQRCLEILAEFRDRPAFPVDHFKWHASQALILNAQGKYADAKRAACDALSWAKKSDSGFRYHRSLGLVEDKYKTTEAQLVAICNA